MESMTISCLLEATGGTIQGEISKTNGVKGVSTDSRLIGKGEVFFALKGPNYDGHDFVHEALQKGGKLAVVSRNGFGPNSIRVEDTLKALGDFAMHYRRRFSIPVIGITGTNGKTTTKDIVAEVLSARFRVKKTRGNLNNLVGLPLSVCQLAQEDEVAVFEMGASEVGEIARLSEIAAPKVGVVTNVGPAHLQFFGSIENVARAKSELPQSLNSRGCAVLNGDDPYCGRMAESTEAQVMRFGLGDTCQVRGRAVETKADGSRFEVEGQTFHTSLLGLPNLYNCLAAISVGKIFGIPLESMAQVLDSLTPSPMRLEPVSFGELLILNDSYNSNPASAASSLGILSETTGERRIAILGDMLELGEESARLHRELGQRVSELRIDFLLTVGRLGEEIAEGARDAGLKGVFAFTSNSDVLEFLKSFAKAGDVYMIKGSRGVAMEEIVEGMRELISPKSE